MDKVPARPMSDARLEELRRLVGIGRGVMDLATLDCIAEIYRLRAENKRLRDPLGKIANAYDKHSAALKERAEIGPVLTVLEWAQLIAREALGGQPS